MKFDGELILTKSKFSKMIENEVTRSRLSYIDTIVHLCEKNNLEISDIKKFLSPSIISRLEIEGMNLNFLPKLNTIELDV